MACSNSDYGTHRCIRCDSEVDDSDNATLEAAYKEAVKHIVILRKAILEQKNRLVEIWGKEEDPYACAYGWSKASRDAALEATAKYSDGDDTDPRTLPNDPG